MTLKVVGESRAMVVLLLLPAHGGARQVTAGARLVDLDRFHRQRWVGVHPGLVDWDTVCLARHHYVLCALLVRLVEDGRWLLLHRACRLLSQVHVAVVCNRRVAVSWPCATSC